MKRTLVNPIIEVNHIVDWIKNYFEKNGNADTKAIIGISGGKDSTIAAALLVRALGAERVIGVLMPNGNQADIDDSRRVCNILGIKNITVDISRTCISIYETINYQACIDNKTVKTNTPARVRMTVLYTIAALYGGRVCNTGNASELWIGYTTKYGDLAGDFSLFRDYTVREVLAIGDALTELPKELVHKAPADGMSGLTDEDNMGITYDQIDTLLLDECAPEDEETYKKMLAKHRANEHKQCINLPCPKSTLSMSFNNDEDWGNI